MLKIIVKTAQGNEFPVEATAGRSVMENIRDAGVDDMVALCGGVCSCATCHVVVDEAWTAVVGDASSTEDELLSMSDQRVPASRLSCQIPMTPELDGLRVTVVPES